MASGEWGPLQGVAAWSGEAVAWSGEAVAWSGEAVVCRLTRYRPQERLGPFEEIGGLLVHSSRVTYQGEGRNRGYCVSGTEANELHKECRPDDACTKTLTQFHAG